MNRKRSQNNAKPQEPPRARRETALKMTLITLICLWMFVLGLLVGRGHAPVRFNVNRLQDELASLKAATVEKTIRRYRVAFEEVDKKMDLGFHDALKESKTDLSDAPALPDKPQPERSVGTDTPTGKTGDIPPKKVRAPAFQKKKSVAKPTAWEIQVAATQDEAYGNELTERLKKMGFPAYLTTAKIPDKGTWYRIRVGGYTGKSDAEADYNRLKEKRFSPRIIAP